MTLKLFVQALTKFLAGLLLVGKGKKVYAYIPDKDSFEPELMYKLYTKVCISLEELIESIE